MNEEGRVPGNIDPLVSNVRPLTGWMLVGTYPLMNLTTNMMQFLAFFYSRTTYSKDGCINYCFCVGINQILDKIKNGVNLSEASTQCSEVDNFHCSCEEACHQHQHSISLNN